MPHSKRAPNEPLPPAAYLRECFDYDPETGVLTWKHRPNIPQKANTRWAGKTAGWLHPYGYLVVVVDGTNYWAHRIVAFVTGSDPVDTIDHIDRDKTNNRWNNLREATMADQGMNKSIYKTNKSGHPGVRQVQSGKWTAKVGGAWLGTFDTFEAAVAARSHYDIL